MRGKLIHAPYSSVVGGHSGQKARFHRISFMFYWLGIKRDIIYCVKQCDACQRNKGENVPYLGLLQLLRIPSQAWSSITMDFIEKLPHSNHYNTILVTVDRLTKFDHFILLKYPFTTIDVAQAFINNVYKLHGLPESITTNKDKVFTSQFWQALFKLASTILTIAQLIIYRLIDKLRDQISIWRPSSGAWPVSIQIIGVNSYP